MHENVKVQDQRRYVLDIYKNYVIIPRYVENTWEKDIDLDVELAKRLKDL